MPGQVAEAKAKRLASDLSTSLPHFHTEAWKENSIFSRFYDSKKGKEPLLANICWSRVEFEYFNLEAEILPLISAQIW